MAVDIDLVPLAGGAFVMGTDGTYGYPQDGEGPAHEVELSPFSISRHAVTNAQFAAFIEATGHRTEAEAFGWSFVFAGFLPGELETRAVVGAPWWRQIEGADWAHPEGPDSSVLAGRTTRRSTSPGTTPSRSAPGAARGCPRRRSGSTRRAAGSRRCGSPGATSSSPAASTA